MKEISITSLHPGLAPRNSENSALGINGDDFGIHFLWKEPGLGGVDYVIVSHLLYYNKKIFKQFLFYMHQDVIFIYIAGECISPDMNLFDYAIVFDRQLSMGDRIIRKSTLSYFSASVFEEYRRQVVTSADINDKTKFCNFMYSNPNAHPMRDNLFYKISEYKRVDAIGSHLRNTDVKPSRFDTDWRRLSIVARQKYRFSIASENACFPGYTSEKLLCCLQAHTVPIYWGDPTIEEEFNGKAFINVHKFKTLDDVLEKVREIDEDESLLLNMLNQPWQTPEQITKTRLQDENYKQFVASIFLRDKNDAKRCIGGYHPWKYREWFENPYGYKIRERIQNLVIKLRQKI